MKITFVLWRGDIGGAERLTAALAAELRLIGVDSAVLFISSEGGLAPDLARREVPFRSLGLGRGRDVLRRPRLFADAVNQLGTDVVIMPSVDFLGIALRVGGYGGPLIGVEHGALLWREADAAPLRIKHWVVRAVSSRVHDGEVAVSQFMRERLDHHPHACAVVISHGVRAASEPVQLPDTRDFVVGFAGRQFAGKGVNQLLQALAISRSSEKDLRIVATIAGTGPMLGQWRAEAAALGLDNAVTFTGFTDDIAKHWGGCHLAVAPNDTFKESFCLSILEAMSFGRVPIVTDLGALPELVVPGKVGLVVPAGEPDALAGAMMTYARDRRRLVREGHAARQRAIEKYAIADTARQYRRLAEDLLNAHVRGGTGKARRPS